MQKPARSKGILKYIATNDRFIMKKSTIAAAFGATIFSIHPFFADSVDYLYARGSMMAAMFVFASCWVALKMDSR
jgi:hypothetical protein